MKKIKEYVFCFLFGAFAYGLIEVATRGYTHWTMALTGGAVMTLLNLVAQDRELNIFIKCLIGCIVITSLEFGVGMIVNVALGWRVWDYSDKPFNVYGQICPLFSLGWYALSLPAFGLCRLISSRLCNS